MPTPIISINQLGKRFGNTVAVDNVSLEVMENEFFALLGPSGCGKTTLLRMIAGLEMPSSGELLLDGQDMTRIPANRRPVNMVFQSYAVFPHMTVEQNVGYGLRVTGTAAAEISTRVREALEMVKLDHLGQRKPDQLSGGQRQRVALARALVKRPRVLLLDEPLSALDAKLREQMQYELSRLQKAIGITFIIVTHDQHEALSMADRIAVMNTGRLAQLASPHELYSQPNSRFVADFIGRINLLDATISDSGNGRVALDLPDGQRIELPGEHPIGTPVTLAVRPENVRLALKRPDDGSICLLGRLAATAYFGDSRQAQVELDNGVRLAVTLREENRDQQRAFDLKDRLWVHWQARDMLLLSA